jgi:hypothetical protein
LKLYVSKYGADYYSREIGQDPDIMPRYTELDDTRRWNRARWAAVEIAV